MVPPTLRQLLRTVVPKHVLETRWEHYFFESRGQLMHFGTFSSREEAQAVLDAHGESGRYSIDQQQWAAERSKTFFAHDYPVLHWLGELVAGGQRLVDLGGSVGVTYYLLRDRMVFPLDFEWQVSELTEVVDIGRRLQAKNAAPQLSFTDDWHAMDGASIVLSAGALQFFPKTLTDMLTQLHDGPDHVIINRIPITDDMDTFFTLQNTGESITPMRVEAWSRFLADIRRSGFEVVDQWKCLENSLDVPFHPECTLRYFRGFYLRRAEQASSGASLRPALSIRPPQYRSSSRNRTWTDRGAATCPLASHGRRVDMTSVYESVTRSS